VDEQALLEAIEAGTVAGAALDVFPKEPPPPSPLFQRDEVILTPHLGASTVEAQASVAVEVAENTIAYLTTGVARMRSTCERGPRSAPPVGSYLELSERLGLFAAQIADGPVTSVQILCGASPRRREPSCLPRLS